jgi:hypothetical protein
MASFDHKFKTRQKIGGESQLPLYWNFTIRCAYVNWTGRFTPVHTVEKLINRFCAKMRKSRCQVFVPNIGSSISENLRLRSSRAETYAPLGALWMSRAGDFQTRISSRTMWA